VVYWFSAGSWHIIYWNEGKLFAPMALKLCGHLNLVFCTLPKSDIGVTALASAFVTDKAEFSLFCMIFVFTNIAIVAHIQ
jgi:hypothetical protein